MRHHLAAAPEPRAARPSRASIARSLLLTPEHRGVHPCWGHRIRFQKSYAMGRLRPVGMGTKRQILTLDSLSDRDANRQAPVGV